MDIKARIGELLKNEKHTLGDLADFLGMTEDDLSRQLNNKSLEIRKFETISKLLRVPLYSFFRTNQVPDLNHKPYYVNKLWTGDDSAKDRKKLREEIALLQEIIMLKETQLNNPGS